MRIEASILITTSRNIRTTMQPDTIGPGRRETLRLARMHRSHRRDDATAANAATRAFSDGGAACTRCGARPSPLWASTPKRHCGDSEAPAGNKFHHARCGTRIFYCFPVNNPFAVRSDGRATPARYQWVGLLLMKKTIKIIVGNVGAATHGWARSGQPPSPPPAPLPPSPSLLFSPHLPISLSLSLPHSLPPSLASQDWLLIKIY